MTEPLVPERIYVDPAFMTPERPGMRLQNVPLAEEVEALATDPARLAAWLRPGYYLWRRSVTRTREGEIKPDDPTFGQKSARTARDETLASYQWFQMFGPTLMLVLAKLQGIDLKEEVTGAAK